MASPGAMDGDLLLTVTFGDIDADVAIEAAPEVTLGDVIGRIEPTLATRLEPPIAIASERLRVWLDETTPLGSMGLIDGDRIVVGGFAVVRPIVERDGPVEAGAIEVVIRGGPRAGERVRLAPGDHIVGRDPAAAVAVPNDPSLSARHARIRVAPTNVALEDLDSTNGTSIDGTAIPRRRLEPLMAGQLVELGRTSLTWRPIASAHGRTPPDTTRVDRPPRVRRPWRPLERTVELPAEPARRVRIPIAASLVPIVLGVVLWRLSDYNPMMLVLSAIGPVVAIASRAEDLGLAGRDRRRAAAAARARLRDLDTDLGVALATEVVARRQEAPDAATLLRRASDRSPELWLRRPDDADALELRVGTADLPSRSRVVLQPPTSPLSAEAAAVVARHGTATAVPVVAPLARWRSIGIAGPGERTDALGRWLVLQAALLHAPSELRIRAVIGPTRLAGWEWLKWLPHVRGGVREGPVLASDASGVGTLLDRVVSAHAGADHPRFASGEPALLVRELVVVDVELARDLPALSRLLRLDPATGVSVICLGGDERSLPKDIGSIARLDRDVARMDLVEVAGGTTIAGVTPDEVSRELAAATARALAPLRDTGALDPALDELPQRISLLEVTGRHLEPGAIERAWATPAPATPIGMAVGGPLTIDLRRDGPHGLIGGTTGSGKSELLQALVAGLALAAPPTQMSFLLIDYKGGAAFRDAASLPHTAGMITDLDARLSRRALVALDAEIRRREAILDQLRVKSLEEASTTAPAQAPPRLVIVVDEFATLVSEVPEFVDGLVDVARRGRTLGVHLILATQRPAGVVSREIWTNTALRIALRVADPQDSIDVIDAPDAAQLPPSLPGRAYVRVANQRPVLVQAAYAGAPRGNVRLALTVREFGFTGLGPDILPVEVPAAADGVRVPAGAAAGPGRGRAAQSELADIVVAVQLAAQALGLEAARSPWLPPLPEVLPLAEVEKVANAAHAPAAHASNDSGRVAMLGLVDEPARQRQVPLTLDLDADGGLLVFGSGGSGRTTILTTAAASLAASASPADLHIYAVDFGAGGLTALEVLPHCGAIVQGADEERVLRLFDFLRRELARRQEARLSDVGTGKGSATTPRIVVLIDGYAAFSATYEGVNMGELIELLPRLATDGRAVGIHLVITADRRASVPSRLATAFARRVVLELADPIEYGQLGLDRRAVAGTAFAPGRGITENGLEAQVAVAGADASPASLKAALGSIAASAADRWPGVRAPGIGRLPNAINLAALPGPSGPGRAVIGIGDRLLEPVEISLDDGHMLVTGPLRSGRSTALATIGTSLTAANPGIELSLLAPRRSSRAIGAPWTTVDEGIDACIARLESLAAAAATRDPADTTWRVVALDDGDELFDGPAGAPLTSLIRAGRDARLRVIAATEVRSTLKAYGGWVTELRKDRHGVLLQPSADVGGELLGATLPRVSRPMPPGRGYLVVRGLPQLVQFAQPDTHTTS